jgi:hypothetical protein
MRWRVMIELTSGDGAVHAREVATGSDDSAGSAVKPLGLTLADAKHSWQPYSAISSRLKWRTTVVSAAAVRVAKSNAP